MQSRPTLLIAHPKELIRTGLQAMLAKTGITIAGEAADPKTALALVKKLRPDVLLIAVGLPGGDCFELLADVRKVSPDTKLIGTSAIENPTYLARGVAAGVADFLWEGVTAKQLVTAIEQAAAGKGPSGSGPYAYGSVAASLTAVTLGARKGKPPGAVPVSPRELQVLAHIAYGLSNEEIARALAIGVETVKERVKNLLRKLAVPDRTAAAVMAVRAGVV
jgi:DNA-binding NarL/FixJ family response regulator